MSKSNKAKLKHDFLNSIVIINSMAKSASNFVNRVSSCANETGISQKQIERFLSSMETIRSQTAILETYFKELLDE